MSHVEAASNTLLRRSPLHPLQGGPGWDASPILHPSRYAKAPRARIRTKTLTLLPCTGRGDLGVLGSVLGLVHGRFDGLGVVSGHPQPVKQLAPSWGPLGVGHGLMLKMSS